MKIDQLKFNKSIYPRHLDLGLDTEIKPDEENITSIREYIQVNKKLPQNITYNKRTMDILDGTHTWEAAKQECWKEIPDKYLTQMDIPEEQERWVAGKLNAEHGLKLSRNEIRAIFMEYHEKGHRMKYGSIEQFSKDFNIPRGTLDTWINQHNYPQDHLKSSDSSKTPESGTDPIEDLQQTKKELEKTLIKLDEANKRIDEFEIKWNTVCSTHKRAISMCKDCGKQ